MQAHLFHYETNLLSMGVCTRGCVGSLQVLLVFQELAFLIAAHTHGAGTLHLGEPNTKDSKSATLHATMFQKPILHVASY